MTVYLFIILILMLIFDIIYSLKKRDYYKKSLRSQEIITRMAKARSRLIEMVQLGEIDPNSIYFKYIYIISSYTIRALYKYGLKSQALENVNVVRRLFNVLDPNEVKNELKNLNYEQKRLFTKVSCDLLSVYIESNYILTLLFKYLKESMVLKIININFLNKIKIINAENVKDVKELNKYANCSNSFFCPA